MHERC